MSENNDGFLIEDAPTDIEPKIEKRTPLDAFRAQVAKEVEKEPITLDVPGRPGMEIRFDTNIEMELLEAWQKRATKRVGNKEHLDTIRLATILIASKAECVIWQGQDMTTEDGAPLNFRTAEFAQMMGVNSTSHGVVIRHLYGYDGHIMRTMNDLLRAAGYDPDVDLESDEEDPTIAS